MGLSPRVHEAKKTLFRAQDKYWAALKELRTLETKMRPDVAEVERAKAIVGAALERAHEAEGVLLRIMEDEESKPSG